VLDPPAWFDPELADAGAVAWWRAGVLHQTLALVAGSLAFGYRSAALARPLAATGRLTARAPRRLGETARWVAEVTQPGAMRVDGTPAAGVRSTVRLRLVHALVRAHLRPDWDLEAWGEPISLADTLVTGLGGFHLVPLRALGDLGVRYAPGELAAMFHLWRWITFLLGVPAEHLPASRAEAEERLEIALAVAPGPGPESAELMHALLWHGLDFDRALPSPLAAAARAANAQVLAAFTRRWLEPELADRLGVPRTPLRRLVPLLRPVTVARDLVRATGALGDDERIGRLELAALDRLFRASGAAPAALAPEDVEARPAVAA
jgi:ER-bound oxygenase mpaB/B'/Rubber oxygenase, catalytic domain